MKKTIVFLWAMLMLSLALVFSESARSDEPQPIVNNFYCALPMLVVCDRMTDGVLRNCQEFTSKQEAEAYYDQSE